MAEELRGQAYGWGYEGRTVEDLLKLAADVGAHTVVDGL